MKRLKEKKVLVIGLGKTGISVINKIRDHCRGIRATDSDPAVPLKGLLKSGGDIELVLGDRAQDISALLEGVDLVIASPGIPDDSRLIQEAVTRRLDVLSEIELAWTLMSQAQKEKTIAVTGTNGKTTAVSLIAKILNDFGYEALPCGNIGLPLIDTLELSDPGLKDPVLRIIEVSSFQLERVKSFRPHVGIILNITNDHIDRHKTMEHYIALKFRLIERQGARDYAILNIDDPNIYGFLMANRKKIRSHVLTYSMHGNSNIKREGKGLSYRLGRRRARIALEGLGLVGEHNVLNIMGAVLASKIFAVSDPMIEKSAASFRPLDHRLEYVATVCGIQCFNDSKATNPDATIKALEYFRKEVTLILGGLDKGMVFDELIPVLNAKVKNLILIGSCREKIFERVQRSVMDYRIEMCESMQEAVRKGFELAGPGEVLLLSPACASMDMFKNYQERGEVFKQCVMMRLKDQ